MLRGLTLAKGEKLVNEKLVTQMKYGYDTHTVSMRTHSVSFVKKRGIQRVLDCLPPPLYDQFPIAIKKAKAEDVRSLVAKYVPAVHQGFYSELPVVVADSDADCDSD